MPVSSPAFTPYRLGPVELRNRIVKCGTNEGMSRGGLMTDPLIDWHREFAAGGVAMTTLAYCSVSSDGRTFRDQIWMRDEALPGLRRFTDTMRAEGARTSIQLGHAGWFATPRVIRTRRSAVAHLRPHAQRFSRATTGATSLASPTPSATRPAWPSPRDSTASKCTSGTAICSPVPVPLQQPADRRVRRQPRESRALSAPRAARGARRGRARRTAV